MIDLYYPISAVICDESLLVVFTRTSRFYCLDWARGRINGKLDETIATNFEEEAYDRGNEIFQKHPVSKWQVFRKQHTENQCRIKTNQLRPKKTNQN